MKTDTLTQTLVATGQLGTETAERITLAAVRETAQEPSPWYFQALTAGGAWVASLFFLGFLVGLFASSWEQNIGPLTVIGLVLIGTATFARGRIAGFFLEQVCLAVSMTGHLLVLISLGMEFQRQHLPHVATLLALVAATLAAVDYFLYRDGCHRFLSSLVALLFGIAALYDLTGRHWLDAATRNPPFDRGLVLYMALHLALLGAIFVRRTAIAWRPLGYAAALSLVAMPFAYNLALFGPTRAKEASILPGLLFLAALLALGWTLLGRRAAWQRDRRTVIVAGLFTVALGAIAPPPLLLALGLIVLGYARQDRFFEYGGLLFLGYSLFVYYYMLTASLASKSLILCASGAVLFLALAVLKKTVWNRR
ncbi:protein of unknown function [Verrucomicrobium sp. GAS474]|uniref:DUF4401 domain-containing protein n=1 Tax=Verrucomicrobium sp. GAS474 TaxID=1882831 RepID=UPI00087A83B7|nr:DUF4401 domain-containing protein [Verrucomicrobium sp. GAS474]SDT96201.1 protein of unknown function [Verrucomicrobium sp. GAS474]